MTPEDREAISQVIRETVNGKIDRLNDKIDSHNKRHEEDMAEVRDHMATTKPIIEGLSGAKIIGETLKWLAGIAAAWIVIKSFLNGN